MRLRLSGYDPDGDVHDFSIADQVRLGVPCVGSVGGSGSGFEAGRGISGSDEVIDPVLGSSGLPLPFSPVSERGWVCLFVEVTLRSSLQETVADLATPFYYCWNVPRQSSVGLGTPTGGSTTGSVEICVGSQTAGRVLEQMLYKKSSHYCIRIRWAYGNEEGTK